jgi:hypothetical protein
VLCSGEWNLEKFYSIKICLVNRNIIMDTNMLLTGCALCVCVCVCEGEREKV